MSAAVVVLLHSIAAILYAYAGYPLLLMFAALIRPRPVRQSQAQPTVTIIVPAHNEEATIGIKLDDCVGQDYPADKLDVLVVSDGSTDATETIVRQRDDARVCLLALPRLGKLNALNEAALHARGEVLVFTDANVRLHHEAVRFLVAPFADIAVGGVCGEKRAQRATRHGDTTAGGEGLYWRYDQWVKRLESTSGTLYGADGALYAIRKNLFVPVRELAQADDLAISARVVIQGFRLIHEPRAACYEDPANDGIAELLRKVRVTNHTLRAIADLARVRPRPLFYWWRLLSHKVARYAVPLWLSLVIGASAWLAASRPLYTALLAAQLVFYCLAIAGWLLRARPAGRLRLLSLPYYFSLVNTAAALALVAWMRGQRTVMWAPRGGAS